MKRLLLLFALPLLGADYTALDRYIEQPDPSFRYQVLSSGSSGGLTWHVVSGPGGARLPPDDHRQSVDEVTGRLARTASIP